MKRSFIQMAIKSLTAFITKLVLKYSESTKFLLEEDALAISEIFLRFYWLDLIAKYRLRIEVKKRRSLPQIYKELSSLMAAFPELKNFSLGNGDPCKVLCEARGRTGAEIISTHGNNVKCIPVDRFQEVVKVVMDYNFTYTFKKELPELFKDAEPKMEAIARDGRWAARGSWNSFVDHVEKEKKEIDLNFLDLFQPSSDQVGEANNDEGPESVDNKSADDPELDWENSGDSEGDDDPES